MNSYTHTHTHITNIITLVMYGPLHLSFHIFKYFYDAFLAQVSLVKDIYMYYHTYKYNII